MAGQTENDRARLVHERMNADNHEGFSHMLFVDAVIGLGFAHEQIGIDAQRGGPATACPTGWAWDRPALEALTLSTLQELYTALKLHEVTHVG